MIFEKKEFTLMFAVYRNNTLLNLRNQQLQQDLARLCDENTQLRLLLSMSQYEIKVKHNNVIDDVIKSLNKLKSNYEPS